MRKRFPRAGIALVLLLIGAVFGPVLFAAIGAAWALEETNSPITVSEEHHLLIEAYRARLSSGLLFTTIAMPDDGTECGYERETVFPEHFDGLERSSMEKRFTPYAGYWVLDRWRSENRGQEYIDAITERMREEMSDFEAGFLRRCIEATLFSKTCMLVVAKFGDKVDRYDDSREKWPLAGYGIEDDIVCTYVDGVAVRRGVPLRPVDEDAGF